MLEALLQTRSYSAGAPEAEGIEFQLHVRTPRAFTVIHVQRTAPPECISVLTDTQHATDTAAAESVASLNLEHNPVQV